MANLTWYISASPKANNDNTGNENLGSNGNQTPNQESTDKSQNTSLQKTAGQMIALSVAKRSVSYVTSNIGKWSGNSRNQNAMNNISKVAGYGMALAVNPYLGMAAIAMDGITYALDYAWENKWNQIQEQQAKVRTGGKGGYRR